MSSLRFLNPLLFVILFLCLISLLFGGKSKSRVNVNVEKNVSAYYDKTEGFDLQLLEPILKKTSDAEELEKQINEENGPNNLDLDEDGKVDYIYVDKLKDSQERGLRLYTKIKGSDGKESEEEIAKVIIKKTNEQSYSADIRGSGNYYRGYNYHYPRFGVGDYLLMSWLFSPRYYGWHRPYGYYGWHRPSYYSRPVMSHSGYTSRTSNLRSNRSQSVRSSKPSASQKRSTAKSANKKYGFKSATSGSKYSTGSSNKYSRSSKFGSSAFGGKSSGYRSYSSSSRSSGGK